MWILIRYTIKRVIGDKSEMKSKEDVKLELAKYLFNDWKDLARGLLVGGHLRDAKRIKYSQGLVKWEMLEPMYQLAYLNKADEILKHCLCNLDTLMHINFNDGDISQSKDNPRDHSVRGGDEENERAEAGLA